MSLVIPCKRFIGEILVQFYLKLVQFELKDSVLYVDLILIEQFLLTRAFVTKDKKCCNRLLFLILLLLISFLLLQFVSILDFSGRGGSAMQVAIKIIKQKLKKKKKKNYIFYIFWEKFVPWGWVLPDNVQYYFVILEVDQFNLYNSRPGSTNQYDGFQVLLLYSSIYQPFWNKVGVKFDL